MVYRKSSTATRERGAVMVEFAMMLPLLVIIFVTIIDLGVLLHEHQVLQNAAREGARFSILPMNQIGPLNPTATVNGIKQRVIDYCAGENVTVLLADITVSQQHPITVGADTIMATEVTVSYTRQLLIAGAPFLPVGDIVLSGNSVFRNFY
jgi:Flp pilus assembly protein TadG